MTLSYLQFMKSASVLTKKVSSARPVLKGVHHESDGTLTATDSHRLYQLENSGLTLDDKTIDPVTGAELEGNFPNVSRIIPEVSNAVETYNIRINKDALKVVEALNKVAVLEESIFTLEQGKIKNAGKNVTFEYVLTEKEQKDPINLLINSQFITDAFKLFYDMFSLAGFNEVSVEIYVFGEARPVLFKSGDLTVLLLPIRKM